MSCIIASNMLTQHLQLLSSEGSLEGMLPVFASTAACDLLLKVVFSSISSVPVLWLVVQHSMQVASCYDASCTFDPMSLFDMSAHPMGASKPFSGHAANSSSVDVEIHSEAMDKLVLQDDDDADSGAATQQLASDSSKNPVLSAGGSSTHVPELKVAVGTIVDSEPETSARQRNRAVQFPTPPQLPTPSPDFSQSMLLRSRLADAGAISALSTALKLTISVDKKDTSQELSRAMEFLQERAAAALASMCKSSRVCRLYINNAAAVDVCSNVMLKTRRDATLHALVLVLSCMFGAISYTDSWW